MGANDRITGPFPTSWPETPEPIVVQPKIGDRVEVQTGSISTGQGERESIYQYGQITGECVGGTKFGPIDLTYKGLLVDFDSKKFGDYGTKRPLPQISQECVSPSAIRIMGAKEE